MAASEADWAGLTEHLLDLIYDKFDLLSDQIRFSAVCPPWRSLAMHNQNHRWHSKASSMPLLMIPTKDNSKKKRSLYRVTDGKEYDFQLHVPYNRRCCGSSYGWLVFFNKTLAPTLFNPFRNKTIHLPPIETGSPLDRYYCEIVKVVLSADPDFEKDYVVASIYGIFGRLAFMKAGDESWTYINPNLRCPGPILDVIFYRGRLLAVYNRKMVLSVDVFSNQVKIISPRIEDSDFHHVYLVESITGDLFMVLRFYFDVLEATEPEVDKYGHMTEFFKVYKLVLDDQTGMVVDKIEVKSLGEETLFFGDSSSMSVLASKYHGLKHNSIYYTDDNTTEPEMGPRDIGMFSLEDKSIHQHYLLNPYQKKHMPPPIWIVPTLQKIRT